MTSVNINPYPIKYCAVTKLDRIINVTINCPEIQNGQLFSYNKVSSENVNRIVDDIIQYQKNIKSKAKNTEKKLNVYIGKCSEKEIKSLEEKFNNLNDETVTVYLFQI